MDFLQNADPVTIAQEHIPIVDALDSGSAELAAALLASHSNHLVHFLKREQQLHQTAPACIPESAAK